MNDNFETDFPDLSEEECDESAKYLSICLAAAGNIKNPPEEVMVSFLTRAQSLIGKGMSDQGKKVVAVMLTKLFAGYMTSQGSMMYVEAINESPKNGEAVH